MNPPLPLPYAPRPIRPLSLWNPLDYLVLLYWVFYFPQALRWYVETFGSLPAKTYGWQAIRQDAIQRRLALQGLVLTLVILFSFVILMRWLGIVSFFDLAFGVAFGAAYTLIALRLDAMLLSLLPALLQPSQRLAIVLQRVSLLPIVRLRRRLAQRLMEDWSEGLCESEGLLRYSLQFIPVIGAIQQALEHTPDNLLLPRLSTWCSLPLYDWQVVLFQSASLRAELLKEFWGRLLIIPRRWWPQIVVGPRYDTPVHAACAGFWHLHEGSVDQAVAAFAAVRSLPHGEEFYANAQSLAAAAHCQSLEQISDWQPPECSPVELLRPQVRAVFEELAKVAEAIALVQHSRSIRQRNSALNRASGMLNDLPKQLSDCPDPERTLFEQIVRQWLEIVLASASAIGALEVRKPVATPYIAGAPVPAHRLAGRQDSFDQIAAAWNKPGQRDSLVIFGHRRMGKSSIVRNLLHFCPFGGDTGLAVLNLQTVDWSQDLSDLCHAIAFQLWQAASVPLDEPLPEDFEQHPLAALRHLLASLDRLEGRGRYILILDEYELLDEKLPEAAANDFITLLRGLTQQYPWLVIALVGLHNLRERSASFYQAIYAWRPIKVGLLDEGSFADMLQVEDDNFPLEYNPAALARAYALVGGQPFLGQLLGDSLVQRFNRQLRVQLDSPLPTFSAEDVDAVVEDPHFYQQGDMYFRGIWAQASEAPHGQQTLLQALAAHDSGLAQEALRQASGLDPHAFSAALDALEQHDVVKCSDGICQYTVELMHRWVASEYRTRMDHGVIGPN